MYILLAIICTFFSAIRIAGAISDIMAHEEYCYTNLILSVVELAAMLLLIAIGAYYMR